MNGAADQLLLGRYRVLRRLGAGGMATVFLAEDERLGRRVAVKRLHADSPEATVRRLEREARLGASLNHPNVVTVYDVGTDEEGALVVMEYVEGETLAAALRRGPLATDRALEVVRAVAAALDHAHGAGVVHRDVKPGNVLLGREGTVKLVDLGIAHAAEHTRLTLTGTLLGTASYMAPEQLEGGRIGPAADVYSLAAVAFEALSGRKAREGATPVEVAHRVTAGPPPDLREAWPQAAEAAAGALERGMARDPAERPRSAGKLADELSAAVPLEGAAPSSAPPTEPTEPAEPAAPPARPGSGGRWPSPVARPGRPAGRGSMASLAGLAVLAIAVGAVLVALLAGAESEGPEGGSDEPAPASRPDRDPQEPAGSGSGSEPGSDTADDDSAEADPGPLFAPGGAGDPARGAQLNEQGKSLIDQGEPGEAVPVLQEAVTSYPEGTNDVNYAFALFNLGNALRLSGQPEQAIPVLERRLQIPNQRGVVRAELRRARAEAAGG